MDFVQPPHQSVFNIQHMVMIDYLQCIKNGDKKASLHPHQVDAVLGLHDYFNPQNDRSNSNIALVVLPTGCGKTGVAVLASYALNALRVLVITPSIIISRQIHEAYSKFLIEHGVIPDTPEATEAVLPFTRLIEKSEDVLEGMRSMVMVVNVHKIGGQSNVRIEDIQPHDHFDLVIVDEAHHYPAPTWRRLVDYFCDSRRLFLTATPEYRGVPIDIHPCYNLTRRTAVENGIIREVMFREITRENERYSVS